MGSETTQVSSVQLKNKFFKNKKRVSLMVTGQRRGNIYAFVISDAALMQTLLYDR